MSDSHRDAMRIKQSRILHSVLLVLESVLFGLFVIAIGCDQVRCVCYFDPKQTTFSNLNF